MPTERVTPLRLLTGHFLRRLLDNDMISPHADRHQTLAIVGALLVSASFFVSFFINMGNLAAFIQLPGPTALAALSDRFLFIAASMGVSALATLLVWEALALEPRDTAILGPLPIAAHTMTAAKLGAVLIFGGGMAIAFNAASSVLYPSLSTFNVHGLAGIGLLRLMAAHTVTVIAAALCGFFGIVAVRGLLRIALGERRFQSVSSIAQSALVVGCVSGLLLAPTVRAVAVYNWVQRAEWRPWAARPVLWYVGLNETLAGNVIVDTPVVMPGGRRMRLQLAPRVKQEDEAARAAYRELRPHVIVLGETAGVVLAMVTVLAIASFLWNSRRLPYRASVGRAPSRARRLLSAMADSLTRRDPETQAGFFFTFQTLPRSAIHRMTVAVATATALIVPIITLAGSGPPHEMSIRSASVARIGIQIVVLSLLIAGFRYAVTVPAELRANWTFRMAWRGDERRYLVGVKRAGIVGFVIAPVLVLLPIHIALFGVWDALLHSLCGVLFGIAALDLLFLGYRSVPFACSYLPPDNLKLRVPLALATLLIVAFAFARIERFAWQSLASIGGLCAALAALVVIVKMVDRERRRDRRPILFDEAPLSTEVLGLS